MKINQTNLQNTAKAVLSETYKLKAYCVKSTKPKH